jgi:hypothetical protein
MARRLGISSPKELVVHRGRPIIDWSVRHLVDAGVTALVVVVRPGKEAIVGHLERAWPGLELVTVTQHGPIGNLVDALSAAAADGALDGHDVHLMFPDTYLEPNPFTFRSGRELTLLCHDAGERWPYFGVVDPVARVVVEKPTHYRGSVCWGAAVWAPSFTPRLVGASSLTQVINQVDWEHRVTIGRYEDIGLVPVPPVPPVRGQPAVLGEPAPFSSSPPGVPAAGG